MSSKVLVVLEDDLDGSKASETVTFAIDGTQYEIDLNEQTLRSCGQTSTATSARLARSAADDLAVSQQTATAMSI